MTKKTSKYDKILNTFIQLLIEGGYQSATISKIAERAEVNPSTIFRNFTDKKGLLSAVVDRHLKDLSTIFDGVSMTGNIEDDLVILSKTYQEFQADHQEIVLIGFQAALEMPEINKAVAENNAQLKEQMQALTNNLASLNNVYGGMLSAMGGGNRNAN